MQFQDRFKTSFSSVCIDDTDLKMKFASLLVMLLFEKLRYSYLIGHFVMDRTKFVIIFPRKLF